LRLAENAKLIALALIFNHLALAAAKFDVSGSRGHETNLAPS